MLDDDVLNNTPLALHIQKIGAEKARQEARQKELVRHRQTLAALVQERFPILVELAEEQVRKIDSPEIVNLLVINLIIAKSEQEARAYLQQA